MIQCTVKGDFRKTRKFLKRAQNLSLDSLLKSCAEEGVEALKSATPVKTGKTADSWSYEISKKHNQISIFWNNSNMNDGVNIAVILEYGHGTGWGGYVQGKRYISPAIQPVFDTITDSIWKEVTKV